MNIAELYTRSRHASSLRHNTRSRTSPTDVLGAAGMAGQRHQTAMLLWGVTYRGRREDINRLADIFADMLRLRMPRTQRISSLKDKHRRVALTVIAWHLHGVCQHCSGRGYDVIPDSPVLSDVLCPSCGGTGKMPLPRSEAHRWLAQEIDALQSMAAGEVMRKLAPRLEL